MATTTRHYVVTLAMVVAIGQAGLSPQASAAPIRDYIALGDSMAFGETNYTSDPSNGDRGYVKLYADSLAQQNGGVRPNVINLGVDGETSGTFFNGGPRGDGTVAGQPAPQLNLNYPSPAPTQNELLLSTIAQEKAAGHVIGTVTLQLGANDLLSAVSAHDFFTLSPAAQQAAVAQILTGVQSRETALLAELKWLAPDANIVMLGYHNPFNADPTSPIGRLADPAIKGLNALIAGEAAAFGARYVDTYTPFLGHELAYTYIASGNVHPNAIGYGVIASQLETVPEPGTWVLFGSALMSCVTLNRRARGASRRNEN